MIKSRKTPYTFPINRIQKDILALAQKEETYDVFISTGSKNVSEIKSISRHQDFDLIVIDYLQLIKSIKRFDISFEVRLSTYAVPYILGEIKRFIRDNGIIKISRSTKQLNLKINKFIEEYLTYNEESPTIDIIAKEFDSIRACFGYEKVFDK